MATCKDCIHYDACLDNQTVGEFEFVTNVNYEDMKEWCGSFKNKADFVEVKHGEWTGRSFDWGSEEEYPILEKSHYLVCSECGHKHFLYIYDFFGRLHKCSTSDVPIIIPNGCPNCLAKMDGRSDT